MQYPLGTLDVHLLHLDAAEAAREHELPRTQGPSAAAPDLSIEGDLHDGDDLVSVTDPGGGLAELELQLEALLGGCRHGCAAEAPRTGDGAAGPIDHHHGSEDRSTVALVPAYGSPRPHLVGGCTHHHVQFPIVGDPRPDAHTALVRRWKARDCAPVAPQVQGLGIQVELARQGSYLQGRHRRSGGPVLLVGFGQPRDRGGPRSPPQAGHDHGTDQSLGLHHAVAISCARRS